MTLAGQRLSFWLAVGGISLLTPFFARWIISLLPEGSARDGAAGFLSYISSSGGA